MSYEEALKGFSKKYEESLAVLLDGKMLTDLPGWEAKEVKKLAREEAFEGRPRLRRDLTRYQRWLQAKRWHGGPSDMIPAEARGAKVLNRMGQVCLRRFHPPRTRKKKEKVAEIAIPFSKSLTLTQKYLAWIKDNDTVPTDDALSFFVGCVNTNWSNARADARELGYEFDRVDGGMWNVIARPLPEVQDLEEDEQGRLLRKVLSMPDLSDGEVVEILRKII